eukprot:g1339.t1
MDAGDYAKALDVFGGIDAEPADDKEVQVKQLFTAFMNADGRIGFAEAKKYTFVTEGPDMPLPDDAWGFVCKWAGCKEDPITVGLNFLQFRKTFLDEYTANLLETDLSRDYAQFVKYVTRASEKALPDSSSSEGAKDPTDKDVSAKQQQS